MHSKPPMATQELLIEFGEEDGDDDDVQALLAAIQSRKEKQAKLKKSIRDRINKSQKVLKDEAEAEDSKLAAMVERMKGVADQAQLLAERAANLPALPDDNSKDFRESILSSKKKLRTTGASAKLQCGEIESSFRKKLQRVVFLLEAEAIRSRNEDVVQALKEMVEEIDRAKIALRDCV